MSENNLNSLLQWAKEKGSIISPKLEFKNISADNIGAFWIQDGDAIGDESLIKIPREIILTLEDAIGVFNNLNQGDFNIVSEKCSNTNGILKLFLAHQRTSSNLATSSYKPYISLLPNLNQVNTPYAWSSELKSYISGTNLGNSIKLNIGQLVEEWWQLINALPEEIPKPEEHFINMKFYYEFKFYTDEDLYNYFIVDSKIDNWTSFPNYLWASIILKSRSFPAYLLKNEKEGRKRKQDEAMLLPVVDLLNHNPKAKVDWLILNSDEKTYFEIKSESGKKGDQVFNNYGVKGNEELLLAYGFCLEDNNADSAALKIKIPIEMLPEIEAQGVKLPHISDYTTSVAIKDTEKVKKGDYSEYEDGLLFFIAKDHVPDNLIKLFQILIKSNWEEGITLRMKLSGLNRLRKAIDAKLELLPDLKFANTSDVNIRNINIYIKSQREIFNSAIKVIKRIEKDLLKDPSNKAQLLSLKSVYKKDIKLQQALLISLGISSYEMVLDSNFQDQYWLLFLIRCYNRQEYIKSDKKDDDEKSENNYLPKWIEKAFKKISNENQSLSNVLEHQYKELYESLIPPLSKTVPEIFGKGKWTIREFVLSAMLLDNISFTRGKEDECLLVKEDY